MHQFVCFNFTTHTYRVYYEQPHIVHQRYKYLRRMKHNRTEDGKPVVYLDETWANAHDGKSRAWVEADKTTGETMRSQVSYIAFKILLIYT